MDETPWIDRFLARYLKRKEAGKVYRSKADTNRVPETSPSHALSDYVGEFEHPAYGSITIILKDDQLQFRFHKITLPLNHYHYDRFDTPNDDEYGRWSVNFITDPQGNVQKILMSLDEAEATFTRKPEASNPILLPRCIGNYFYPSGVPLQVALKEDGSLYLQSAWDSEQKLVPYKELKFRLKEFADVVFEFIHENEQIIGLKRIDPGGEVVLSRK